MARVDNFSKEQLEALIRNSSTMRELLRKLGYESVSGSNAKTVQKRIDDLQITAKFKGSEKSHKTEDEIFCENSTVSQSTLRRRYRKQEYTPYICSICGMQPIWQEKELTLILDHINGRSNDNRLANLRWVCPNCNQQLETTGFKTFRTRKK